MRFSKGHGTQNDFVILPDPSVGVELTVERVTALCDRQRGLGADGVLRVARAGELVLAGVLETLGDGIAADDWFMDYRNADGSIAEMCGNGVRVFAHYLVCQGLVWGTEFVVGSRAGARPVVVHSSDATTADVSVSMGPVRDLGVSTARVSGRDFTGVGIDVGNPHLACIDESLSADDLANLDLSQPPGFDPDLFPHGVNVEILTAPRGGDVTMRVYERGVGETRSCGTGTVAAAAAALRQDGRTVGDVRVHVLGGTVVVTIDEQGATLRGPSVLVANGEISEAWWNSLT